MSNYKCPHCQTPAGATEWRAKATHLWGNQHGVMIRVFCEACKSWTDNRVDGNGVVIRWRFVGNHKPVDASNEWHESAERGEE